jgi:hypothetical protein
MKEIEQLIGAFASFAVDNFAIVILALIAGLAVVAFLAVSAFLKLETLARAVNKHGHSGLIPPKTKERGA